MKTQEERLFINIRNIFKFFFQNRWVCFDCIVWLKELRKLRGLMRYTMKWIWNSSNVSDRQLGISTQRSSRKWISSMQNNCREGSRRVCIGQNHYQRRGIASIWLHWGTLQLCSSILQAITTRVQSYPIKRGLITQIKLAFNIFTLNVIASDKPN